jgi:hypothetical protein
LKKSIFGLSPVFALEFEKSKPFEYLGAFLRILPKHPKITALESLISGPGYNSQ